MLPSPLYEKVKGGTTKIRAAEEHPLWWVLEKEPNREQTPFEFKTELIANALLRGDSYAQVVRSPLSGHVQEIWPLLTCQMEETRRVNGWLYYDYRDGAGKITTLTNKKRDILHLKGFTDKGFLGYAMAQRAATTFGKMGAMDEFGARVFKTGMSPGSVVETEHQFKTKEDKQAFADKLSDTYGGVSNSHKVAVFDNGMKFRTVGITAQEAQMIEGMTFQVQEVARIFGIPPHLLMELSKATFSNIEHQMIQFIQLTLGPWMTNIEQRMEKVLLEAEERKTYYIEFMVDALLRTDIKTRFEALRIAVGQPFMSVNEGRDKLNMDPVDGYDDIAKPLNMGNPGGNPDLTDEAPDEAPKQDGDSGTRDKACGCGTCDTRETREIGERVSVERRAELRDVTRERRSLRGAFRKQIQRDSDRLMKGVNREMRKLSAKHLTQRDASDFGNAVSEYFESQGGFRAAVEKILGPIFETYAEAMISAVAREQESDAPDLSDFVQNYIEAFIKRKGGSFAGQMRQLIESSDPDKLAEAIEQRLTEWEEGREDGKRKNQAEKIASTEAVKLGDAVARTAFVALGVTRLAWVANAEACPLCEELDGQIVGVEETFVEASEEVDPGDDNIVPLKARGNINHPPLHGGCECMLAAA